MADEPTDAELAAATATDPGDTTIQQTGTADLGDSGKRALDEERRARRKAEKELADLRKQSMSENERAIAEAKSAAIADANKAAAPRLIRAELRAAAAEAGVPKEALDGFLEYADLSRFTGDDGEPDSKQIAAAVKRLGGSGRADFDGGARGGSARPTDMSTLIRQKAGVI